MKRSPAPTPWRSFGKTGLRYLIQHPLQSALTILGITLGVAVIVAIDYANSSASRGFELSTWAITGRATHQVIGGPRGLDQSVYTNFKLKGLIDKAAPTISAFVWSPQLGSNYLQLLGVDPFAEQHFRDYLAQMENPHSDFNLIPFLTEPGALLISRHLADSFNISAGDRITVFSGGKEKSAWISGVISPPTGTSSTAVQDLILADISTAQELTDQLGKLSAIDLIVSSESRLAEIENALPAGTKLIAAGANTESIQQTIAAFQINLLALSLLALLVGMFLIYNTMTFSVVRRRALLGTLRALGATKREIFMLTLSEAFGLGVLGAALGVLLGIVLGQGSIQLVTRTIHDLYFVTSVTEVGISMASILKGALTGIVASVIAAAIPAWEASSVSPMAALARSSLESKLGSKMWIASAVGVVAIILGVLGFIFSGRDLTSGFLFTFIVILGFAFLTPALMKLLIGSISFIPKRSLGSIARMAPQAILRNSSRTAVAIAALMIAVATTIGMSTMIGSFRHTVEVWLSQTLTGDIYVFSPSATTVGAISKLDPRIVELIERIPEIERAGFLRTAQVSSRNGPINVSAINYLAYEDEGLYHAVDQNPEHAWKRAQEGGVLISEPLGRRLGLLELNSVLTLETNSGPTDFPVVGIYFDYASSQGNLMMDAAVFAKHWGDDSVTDAALWVDEGTDVEAFAEALETAFAPIQQLIVRPNARVRAAGLRVFDRTFTITYALQFLAVLVAFIGVMSTLLSLQLDKIRELGILRALGFSIQELRKLIFLETGLMGLTAGVFAIPTGFILALILTYIINRRAFGWTLQWHVEPGPFVMALAVSVGAALLAGIYPAIKAGRVNIVQALRSE